MVWVLISFVTTLSTLSIISLENMHINVIIQSPFFIYSNVTYVISITVVLIVTIFLAYMRNDFYAAIPLLTLWSLILIAPYMIYMRSLPVYNDQLGFVGEVLSGALFGYAEPLQGEPSSLGHAYFTTAFAIVGGLNPLWGVVIVQLMLPIIYVLPLLTVKRRLFSDVIFVALIVLATMLNPLFYGRTPFAWSYLVLFTVYLYNKSLGSGKKRSLDMPTFIVLMLVCVAYVISDPTSLMIPIMLLITALFNRKFVLPALLATVTWFTVNLVLYISGSLYSVIMQLMTLIEQPTNPMPGLIVPAVNPIIKLYNYLRELTVFLSFLVGLIASIAITVGSKRGKWGNNGLSWVALYFVLVALQVAALVMNRWGMVPYSIYVLTALPALVLTTIKSKWFRLSVLAIAMLLLVLSPVVKWGFSPIAFPTANDLAEVSFITNHVTAQTTVCASGVHQLLRFYYWFYNMSAPIMYIEPLPTTKASQLARCNYIAVFYRTLNTYRLDVSESQLMSIIATFDNNCSVIYKSGAWTMWLK